MQFMKISADRYDDVIDHLQRTFFVEEPLSQSVNRNDYEKIKKYCYDTMTEGLSMMALTEDNEVN